jgi:hypothetical protein
MCATRTPRIVDDQTWPKPITLVPSPQPKMAKLVCGGTIRTLILGGRSIVKVIFLQTYSHTSIKNNFCHDFDDDPIGPWCIFQVLVQHDGGYRDREYCNVPIWDSLPAALSSMPVMF